jgi:membrane protein YqaA with SNARE-associated domain
LEEIGLAALFVSSFLAATLLPGGSEAALLALLKFYPHQFLPALAVATLGNTAGGMTSYLVGCLLPETTKSDRGVAWVRRHGTPVLLLSWLPVVGDALCVAAGWLRLDPWRSFAFMAAGKLARYVVLALTARAVWS